MTDKLTYTKALDAVLNGKEVTDEIRSKLEALKASLEKKSSADRKPTAKQTENDGIKEEIANILATNGKPMTVSEIQKSLANHAELSNQRVSALIRQMILTNEVVRSEVKRVAYFALA